MRRVAGAIGLSVLLLALVLASAALAWRRPTRTERRAISTVAARAAHAGSGRVHVSAIHISTVGPWASARVTIYFGNQPDTAIDILRKRRGHWRNVSLGTAGEWCVMPRRDQRNLGFPARYPCH